MSAVQRTPRRRHCGSSSTAWRRGHSWEAAAGTGDALSRPGRRPEPRLEVGIGLDRQALVLHYSKLEREQPLFRIPANSGMETVRALGPMRRGLLKSCR